MDVVQIGLAITIAVCLLGILVLVIAGRKRRRSTRLKLRDTGPAGSLPRLGQTPMPPTYRTSSRQAPPPARADADEPPTRFITDMSHPSHLLYGLGHDGTDRGDSDPIPDTDHGRDSGSNSSESSSGSDGGNSSG